VIFLLGGFFPGHPVDVINALCYLVVIDVLDLMVVMSYVIQSYVTS